MVFLSVYDIRLHRSAGKYDGGNIEPSCRHKHSGCDFVAVCDPDPTVQGMREGHYFDIICYMFPAREAEPHLYEHSNAITNTWHAPFQGNSARIPYAPFHLPGQVVEVNVSRNNVVVTVGNANKGFAGNKILCGQARTEKQCPVWQCFDVFLQLIRTHA